MRRLVAAVAAVLLGAVTLTACGNGDSSSNADLPVRRIAITFNGDDTSPNGSDIDVEVGQPIEFDVTADKPGEIHVHSDPEEQEFKYEKGSSTLDVTPIQAPGRVTVESHTLEKTLFILVAR